MPAPSSKPTSAVQIMVDVMSALKTGLSGEIPNESTSYTVGANFETEVMGNLAPDTTAFHICMREGSDIGSAVPAMGRQIPLLLNIALQGDAEQEQKNGITVTDGLLVAENLVFKAQEIIASNYIGQDAIQFQYYLDATESPIVRAEVEITISL